MDWLQDTREKQIQMNIDCGNKCGHLDHKCKETCLIEAQVPILLISWHVCWFNFSLKKDVVNLPGSLIHVPVYTPSAIVEPIATVVSVPSTDSGAEVNGAILTGEFGNIVAVPANLQAGKSSSDYVDEEVIPINGTLLNAAGNDSSIVSPAKTKVVGEDFKPTGTIKSNNFGDEESGSASSTSSEISATPSFSGKKNKTKHIVHHENSAPGAYHEKVLLWMYAAGTLTFAIIIGMQLI